MLSSLPRIKTTTQNSRTAAILKYKRIHLLQQGDKTSNFQKRTTSKKQLRSQKMQTGQQISILKSPKSYRNQNWYENDLQKKIFERNVDETMETDNDLSKIKVKMNKYRNQNKIQLQALQKVKKQTNQIKKQIQIYMTEKRKFQNEKQKIQSKSQVVKKKEEKARYQNSVYEQMIKARQSDNIFLRAEINKFKEQMGKLKSFETMLDKQALDASNKCKLIELAYENLKNQSESQKSSLQLFLLMEKDKLESKISTDQMKFNRNKNMDQIKEIVSRQEQQKEFNRLYKKILLGKFQEKWLDIQLGRQTEKYKQIQGFYQKICSFARIPDHQPERFSERFYENQPESLSVKRMIKQKEERLYFLQDENNILHQKIGVLEQQALSFGQNKIFQSKVNKNQIYIKKIQNLATEELQKKQKLNIIKKWVYNSLLLMRKKPQKNNSFQATIQNFKTLKQSLNLLTLN